LRNVGEIDRNILSPQFLQSREDETMYTVPDMDGYLYDNRDEDEVILDYFRCEGISHEENEGE
jgi:hypothetical protein